MTWKEFKDAVEAGGIKDDSSIVSIHDAAVGKDERLCQVMVMDGTWVITAHVRYAEYNYSHTEGM